MCGRDQNDINRLILNFDWADEVFNRNLAAPAEAFAWHRVDRRSAMCATRTALGGTRAGLVVELFTHARPRTPASVARHAGAGVATSAGRATWRSETCLPCPASGRTRGSSHWGLLVCEANIIFVGEGSTIDAPLAEFNAPLFTVKSVVRQYLGEPAREPR